MFSEGFKIYIEKIKYYIQKHKQYTVNQVPCET